MYASLLYPVRDLLRWLVLLGAGSLPTYGQPAAQPLTNTRVATQWANLSLAVIRSSPHNSPTYASRSLAYLGIAMYESVVHSNPHYRSLAGQLNGLAHLPGPDTTQRYNWSLVLNTAQGSMLYKLYPHASRQTALRIDSLQRAITTALVATEQTDVAERSIRYAWSLVNALFEWSKTDGGHAGYYRNFDPTYALPTGTGYWVPPVRGQSASRMALHPTWGQNRTFVPANGRLPIPADLPYSADSASAYYREHRAVYRKKASLTRAEKEIAIWWADDPSQTAAPPGHSYNLATLTIQAAQPEVTSTDVTSTEVTSMEAAPTDVVKVAQTYAAVGMAVADAFINCWKCKYRYHRERPSTFITSVIDPAWQPFWPEPPFPAYSSGHATQAAAAATVLTALYGDGFALTDVTHTSRPPEPITGLPYTARRFASFWEMAEECAQSRLYGGIHTNLDNQTGLAQGRAIGRQVNALQWRWLTPERR